MAIRRLPEYLINRLKAGEIVERPASILKELVENSLDAGATHIKIDIHDGGKSRISVEDNGSGIELSDMELVFERYATSKIYSEQDLFSLNSYGFRGEALASIAEVSKTTILSKTAYSDIGTQLTKLGMDPIMKHLPVGFEHGTIVTVEDLFYNVPARLKFLKSAQTEFFYCYNYITDIALIQYDKAFVFKKNNKIVFDLSPRNSSKERILDIYKKDRSNHIKEVYERKDEVSLYAIIGNSQLVFGSAENIKIYVNKRPVQDKLIKKALMDVYYRQIAPNEYPFAILMIEATPSFVDVNVHPRKLEVKFADPKKVYDIVYNSIQKALGEHRIATIQQQFSSYEPISVSSSLKEQRSMFSDGITISQPAVIQNRDFGILTSTLPSQEPLRDKEIGEYKIIGQLWNTYILIEANDALLYVDQHALAERIIFEKMKISIKEHAQPEVLLQPLTIDIPVVPDRESKLDQINALGFDVSMISETKIAIYAVPQVFSMYKIDLEKLFRHVLYMETINFDTLLDNIFATHACKIAIKAGDPLSLPEMTNLIKEGFQVIKGLFVCQHGRPFFIKTPKSDIDAFFDR